MYARQTACCTQLSAVFYTSGASTTILTAIVLEIEALPYVVAERVGGCCCG